ncbi:MAG: DUF255 domain-containing protein, partial [bacterium]
MHNILDGLSLIRCALLVSLFASEFAFCGEQQPVVESGLKSHSSPYLRQHADDPIHWRTLNRSTMDLAASLQRPILISSGYMSCYWCLRMQQDTFSDVELATLINANFIPILIDRELNPIEDQFLQNFAEESQGFSGWPITVLLTHSGNPLFAYGYIDRQSLIKSLNTFVSVWNLSSDQISAQARIEAEKSAETTAAQELLWTGGELVDLLNAFIDQTNAAADPEFGGFGFVEKYPFVPQLFALMDLNAINPNPELSSFITLTLDNILEGSLIDKVEGGVFRYTEQRDWGAPHFEQMLSTQVMVAKLLLRGARMAKNPDYQEAGLRILDNMIGRMRSEDGGYVSSLSAFDSAGEDGGYYTWDVERLEYLLGDKWQRDLIDLLPHAEVVLPDPIGIQKDLVLQTLRNDRKTRDLVRDTKVLLGLNGLALSSLVAGASVRADLIGPARDLANQLMTQVATMSPDLEAVRGSPRDADLATYVYVAAGLFDWWQLTAEKGVLDLVASLLIAAQKKFYNNGKWRSGEDSPLVREQTRIAIKDDQLPSPSAEWFRLGNALTLTDNIYKDDVKIGL